MSTILIYVRHLYRCRRYPAGNPDGCRTIFQHSYGQRIVGRGLTLGASALTEGAEEFISDWLGWQMPRLYGGDVATAEETLSDSLYDFLMAASVGGGGAGGPPPRHSPGIVLGHSGGASPSPTPDLWKSVPQAHHSYSLFIIRYSFHTHPINSCSSESLGTSPGSMVSNQSKARTSSKSS